MPENTVTEPSLLLDYLFRRFPTLKKTKVKQILKFGSVRVNGRIVTLHRHALRPGDKVEILSEKDAFAEGVKSALDFRVVYEDEAVLVIDKPPGLLTMATEKEKVRTAYFRLTEYARAKSADGRGRIFIVHRLDRDASGLVVFARTPEAKEYLQKHWPRALKKYYAVVEGVPEEKSGRLASHLVEDSFRRVYSLQNRRHDSKEAVTHYELVRDNGRYALLDLELQTGRKNQIRVQLADLGHPIAGDFKYRAKSNPARRLALHAHFLSFPHPVTGKIKSFTSPLPENLENLLFDPSKNPEKA